MKTQSLWLPIVFFGIFGSFSAHSAPSTAILNANSSSAIPDQYIVVFRNRGSLTSQAIDTLADQLTRAHHGKILFRYHAALQGFAVRIPPQAAEAIARNPNVAYVSQDQVVHLTGTQTSPPAWGLDRIDQRDAALNGIYSYGTTASDVHVYILDTGIRLTHSDFGGRAVAGYDAVGDANYNVEFCTDDPYLPPPDGFSPKPFSVDDTNGHGTAVAGVVGGNLFGVAKGVALYAVRVFKPLRF